MSVGSMPVWPTERIPGQPGLHRQILSWTTRTKQKDGTAAFLWTVDINTGNLIPLIFLLFLFLSQVYVVAVGILLKNSCLHFLYLFLPTPPQSLPAL